MARLEADLAQAPDGLWHYTDAGGLQGILANEVLWATDTRFLNDATEIHYGLELAEEAVEAVRNAGSWAAPTKHFLRRVMASDGANLTGFLRARSEVFVACLCEDGDLLSQWRAYAGGDSAGGYALQFRHRQPITGWIAQHGRDSFRLQRVIYDRAEQLEAFADLVNRLAPIYDVDHSEQRMDVLARNLVDGILEVASFCKHPSFSEEREWRIVYERSNDKSLFPVLHRTSRGLIVPYVELCVPGAVGEMAGHMPIVEIRCGPSAEPELKQHGVKRFVQFRPGYEKVVVSGSDTPLRL